MTVEMEGAGIAAKLIQLKLKVSGWPWCGRDAHLPVQEKGGCWSAVGPLTALKRIAWQSAALQILPSVFPKASVMFSQGCKSYLTDQTWSCFRLAKSNPAKKNNSPTSSPVPSPSPLLPSTFDPLSQPSLFCSARATWIHISYKTCYAGKAPGLSRVHPCIPCTA